MASQDQKPVITVGADGSLMPKSDMLRFLAPATAAATAKSHCPYCGAAGESCRQDCPRPRRKS